MICLKYSLTFQNVIKNRSSVVIYPKILKTSFTCLFQALPFFYRLSYWALHGPDSDYSGEENLKTIAISKTTFLMLYIWTFTIFIKSASTFINKKLSGQTAEFLLKITELFLEWNCMILTYHWSKFRKFSNIKNKRSSKNAEENNQIKQELRGKP